jgi:hypothetical protein
VARLLFSKPGVVNTTYAEEDGKLVVARTQDVEPVLEANKRRMNDAPGLKSGQVYQDEVFNKVASIPMVVVEQWMKEGIDIFNPDHADAVNRKLNDPEYRYLRTLPGKL